MGRGPTVLTAAALVAMLLVGGLAVSGLATDGIGVATANHDGDGNYTVEPMTAPADRQPGEPTARYGQRAVSDRDVDTLRTLVAIYHEGSFADCGPEDAEEFGIDRGNDNEGYETDEDLDEYVRSFSTGEDRFEVQFNREDDLGPTAHLTAGDAILSLAECIGNPAEPGWYQIEGEIRGTDDDGDEVVLESVFHYFWICDCETEEQARDELGPPPSEADADAETEGEGDSEADGNDASADTGAATPGTVAPAGSSSGSNTRAAGGPATTTPTDDATAGSPGDDDTTTSGTADSDDWEDHVYRTPTAADGPGFGVVAGILAGVLAAVCLRRH